MKKTLSYVLIALASFGCGPVDGDCFDRCYKNCRDDGGGERDCSKSCEDICRQGGPNATSEVE